MSRRRRLSLGGLVALLATSGTLHLVMPGPYRRIVPRPLRRLDAQIVLASGLAELACAAMLVLPGTRRAGALATTALLVSVFPANVQMALDTGDEASFLARHPSILWARLPLQIPLILWALRFRRPA